MLRTKNKKLRIEKKEEEDENSPERATAAAATRVITGESYYSTIIIGERGAPETPAATIEKREMEERRVVMDSKRERERE